MHKLIRRYTIGMFPKIIFRVTRHILRTRVLSVEHLEMSNRCNILLRLIDASVQIFQMYETLNYFGIYQHMHVLFVV